MYGRHVPGSQNDLADSLSRNQLPEFFKQQTVSCYSLFSPTVALTGCGSSALSIQLKGSNCYKLNEWGSRIRWWIIKSGGSSHRINHPQTTHTQGKRKKSRSTAEISTPKKAGKKAEPSTNSNSWNKAPQPGTTLNRNDYSCCKSRIGKLWLGRHNVTKGANIMCSLTNLKTSLPHKSPI